jgi:hypothetical protein
MLPDLPGIGDLIKLRGDEGSDIRKIIDIGPNEATLKELMQEWYDLTGMRLPPQIYEMEYDEIEPFMRGAVERARRKIGGARV